MDSSENQKPADAPSDRSADVGRNVILVGMMGCGKSSVGWHLAQLIGYAFVDLDDWIEKRTGRSVEAIFADSGEAAFRQEERRAIDFFAGARAHVFSMGGGALEDPESWAVVEKMGVTVWLKTSPEELVRRLLQRPSELQKRPLLRDVADIRDPEKARKLLLDRLGALLGQRQSTYRQAAFAIDNAYATAEATAKIIQAELVQQGFLKISTVQRHEWRY